MTSTIQNPLKTVAGWLFLSYLLLQFFFWDKGTFVGSQVPWPVIGFVLGFPFLFMHSTKLYAFPIFDFPYGVALLKLSTVLLGEFGRISTNI